MDESRQKDRNRGVDRIKMYRTGKKNDNRRTV